MHCKDTTYHHRADSYDQEAREYGCYGHEVLFGMCFEYIRKGQRLLDLGIGTGLGSQNFAQLGLQVYGIDLSGDMLDACEKKGFTDQLRRCDISCEAIPCANGFFDHVISSGVLHFLEDLAGIFTEVQRVIRVGGIFAFSIAPTDSGPPYLTEKTGWGVDIVRHSPKHLVQILNQCGFQLLKEQRLLYKGFDKSSYSELFSVMICQYNADRRKQ